MTSFTVCPRGRSGFGISDSDRMDSNDKKKVHDAISILLDVSRSKQSVEGAAGESSSATQDQTESTTSSPSPMPGTV